eukprot:13217-Heterococcus_DN1.PRE.2
MPCIRHDLCMYPWYMSCTTTAVHKCASYSYASATQQQRDSETVIDIMCYVYLRSVRIIRGYSSYCPMNAYVGTRICSSNSHRSTEHTTACKRTRQR